MSSAIVKAEVRRKRIGQEVFHAGEVRLLGRRVFRIVEQPSEQAVQVAILDWARAMGKEVEWHYRSNKNA